MELVPAGCTLPEKLVHITTTMITFGMGASTQALFARDLERFFHELISGLG
jgi:K(+)-stimulated pyrophosphate-energized sodium pump